MPIPPPSDLLDFELFTETPAQCAQALWRFEMRDERQPAVTLGNLLQRSLIELPKADRLGLGAGPLAAWVTFFEHWREERTMAGIGHPPVQEVLSRVRRLSADEEARRLAFVRERALRDEATLLREAREEGLEILLQLLRVKFGPLSEAARALIAQADADTLLQWSARVLTAATPEEVVADGKGE